MRRLWKTGRRAVQVSQKPLAKFDKILSERHDRILLFLERKYNIVTEIQKTDEKDKTILCKSSKMNP